MSRCRFSLENYRFIEVTEWKRELRVDLREWKDDKPTKKGISLALMRWKNWIDYLEYADQSRTEKQNHKSHLGGKVYCTITKGTACMDIRQYWKPQEEMVPTKKGLCLRPQEYIDVKELTTEIGRALPETRRGRTLLCAKGSHKSVRGITVFGV